MNTILFVNITFIIDRMGATATSAFLCSILALACLMLYRPVRRELVRVAWIRRCFCPQEGMSRSYRIKKNLYNLSDGELGATTSHNNDDLLSHS